MNMEFWNQFLNSTICIPSTISLVPNVQIITPFITPIDTDTNSSLNSDCLQLQHDDNDGYNQDNNGNYVIEQKDDNEEEDEDDDDEEVEEDNENEQEKDVEKKQSIQRIRYLKEEYRCEQCSYTCTIEKAFLRHIRWCESGDVQSNTTTTNHPLSCPICGKDRKNQELLSIHMNKHRQDKHFCCDICKFKSLQLKKLIQHRRMHTGEKPHLCPFCSYRSARRDNLRSHARRMHKKNDLPCDTFIPRSMVLSPRKKQ